MESNTQQCGRIGVFDSGYGGLTVLKEIQKELPEYGFLYLGDNARAPYGIRSFELIHKFTLDSVKYLFREGCPLVILACNTASAKALRIIQQENLPILAPHNRVLGVIRPTVERLSEISETGEIGILATPGTIASDTYRKEIRRFHPTFKTYNQACPMFVPLVENGEANGNGADFFVKKYMDELFKQSNLIDTIILGCTHYPLLIEKIRKYVPDSVKIIPQGAIVAQALKEYLNRHPEIDERLLKSADTIYLTTESSDKFDQMASHFIDKEIMSSTVCL